MKLKVSERITATYELEVTREPNTPETFREYFCGLKREEAEPAESVDERYFIATCVECQGKWEPDGEDAISERCPDCQEKEEPDNKNFVRELSRINDTHGRRTGIFLHVDQEENGVVIEAKTSAGTFALAHGLKDEEAFRLARALDIYETAKEAR